MQTAIKQIFFCTAGKLAALLFLLLLLLFLFKHTTICSIHNKLLWEKQMHDFNHMDYKTDPPIPLPLLPLSALSIILSELCLSIKRQKLDLHYIIHSEMVKLLLFAVFDKLTFQRLQCMCSPVVLSRVTQDCFFMHCIIRPSVSQQ